jgi:hypothetical protein
MKTLALLYSTLWTAIPAAAALALGVSFLFARNSSAANIWIGATALSLGLLYVLGWAATVGNDLFSSPTTLTGHVTNKRIWEYGDDCVFFLTVGSCRATGSQEVAVNQADYNSVAEGDWVSVTYLAHSGITLGLCRRRAIEIEHSGVDGQGQIERCEE